MVDLIFKKHHFTLILGILLYYFDGCAGSSLLRGLSLVAECRLLPVAASLAVERRLWGMWASVVVGTWAQKLQLLGVKAQAQ